MKKGKVFVYQFFDGLYINLTNACCNNCEFCLRNNGDGVGTVDTLWLEREPSFEDVISDIESADFAFKEIVFCGYGEPIIKLEVLKCVCDYLKQRYQNIPIRLNTNGLGNAIFNRDITHELQNRIDIVSISLNAENAENYNKVCHSSFGLNAFDFVLDFARACVKRKIKTILSVVDIIGQPAIKKCQKIAHLLGAELRIRTLITDNNNYN